MEKKEKKEAPPLRCSFCNKNQNQVKKLIAGPRAYICDECVQICLEIITEEKIAAQKQEKPKRQSTSCWTHFNCRTTQHTD